MRSERQGNTIVAPCRQRQGSPARRPFLEELEDRTLLAIWLPKGSAPILNGQTPGRQPVSGRIAAVAALPSDPNILYVAAAGGGVWKTTNAGLNWAPLTDDQRTLFMGALAIAPSQPNTVYAGTGEADNSADSFYGLGVLKSTDGGANWMLLGQDHFARKAIAQIVVHPSNPNIVYVAVANSLRANGVPGNTGIWKSTDGGLNWVNTTTSITMLASFSDLVMVPGAPQALYAAVGSDRDQSSNRTNGLYKTLDGGNSWFAVVNFPSGANDAIVGRIKIGIDPTNTQNVYGSVARHYAATSQPGSLYKMMRSTDGGLNWVQLSNTPDFMAGIGWYATTLAVGSDHKIYAGGGGENIFESTNLGANWTNINTGQDGNGPHADNHGITFDANGRLLVGTDGGIWRLDNSTIGSIHWSDLNSNLEITQFNGIALHATDPTTIFGGSQDNGLSQSQSIPVWTLNQGGDVGIVRYSSTNPSRMYFAAPIASYGPFDFFQRSDNGGVSWFSRVSGINSSDPMDFYPPFVVGPNNGDRLLFGTNRVYLTTTAGNTWVPISTPFQPGWTTDAPIDSLAMTPADPNTIYATAGGHIFVTFDQGMTWQHRDAGLQSLFAGLAVDPANNQIAYAVSNVFSGGNEVWRTFNGGVNWTNITGNLPDLPAWTIIVDPRNPGTHST
jgi:photosystem II stability/assembly factor-like uncharacterized protein